ncbi:MAG: hypothetical protein WC992_08630 [Acholeplasmataceae bacterium]|jgi:hypothetical protein
MYYVYSRGPETRVLMGIPFTSIKEAFRFARRQCRKYWKQPDLWKWGWKYYILTPSETTYVLDQWGWPTFYPYRLDRMEYIG